MHRKYRLPHLVPARLALAPLSLALLAGGCTLELVTAEPVSPAPVPTARPGGDRTVVATSSPEASEPEGQPRSMASVPPTALELATQIEREEGLTGDPFVLDLAQSDGRAQATPPISTQTRPQSPNVRQVTFAHEGGIFDPTVSRDGRHVVYASTQHRPTSDIYIKRLDSRVQTQLTSDPANDAMPALSPDGKRIAFASDRAGTWDIYVMPADGGRPLQITSDPSHEIHPSWSPDGRRLVFNRRGLTSGRWEIWIVDAMNAATAQFLGYGLFPEWCPTSGTGIAGGDRILFQRGRERGDRAYAVWTLEYDGANATNFTEIVSGQGAALINPTWSPDGERILYASVAQNAGWRELTEHRPDRSDLWMIDVQGTNLVRLTEGDAVDLMPTWAGQETILFASDRGGSENLWSLDVRSALAIAERGAYATAEDGNDGK